ncbi:MAG: winged helix-turn-helix domain-containing protein [Chloracidobacterium sp.]|nr:winged helix-turn-helix domain-containing protein [Chloracidobacterium sp.]
MVNGDSQLREFGRFRLDTKKRVLWFDDQPVSLPLKEIELLCVLTDHSGQVVTKDELLEKVWADSFVEDSNLTRHIYLLRKTFKEYGEDEGLIQTVPRRGYRFTGKVRERGNGDIVIERHTVSRTMIELADQSQLPTAKQALPGRAGLKRYIPLGVLGIGAFLLLGYFGMTYLSGPTVPAALEVRSIAVLPVKSFSGTANDEELRMRITDALITRLGNLTDITVRPTSAVMPFAGSDEDSIAIGRKLRVDAIVDSRIQQEGERLRVTLQLVRVADGEHMWSGQIDGMVGRILELQDVIAAQVSSTFDSTAGNNEPPAQRLTENADAYEAYLKGRYFWTKRDEGSLRKAIEYFKQATTFDPRFSEAFTGLADTQHLIFNYNIDVRPEVVSEAKDNLRKALELKPDSPDALITLGTIEMGYDWKWADAERTLQHAVSVAPNSATARIRHGALLLRLRRFDDAINEFERHIQLDPLSINGNSNLGMALFCKKDFAAAERQFLKVLELDDKNSAPYWFLSRSYWLQGQKGQAIEKIVQALELDQNEALSAKIRDGAAASGPEAAIELLLHEWRENPSRTNPHNLAYLSTYLNDTDKAVYWLQRSIDERHPWTSWIAAAPEFDDLRNDARYLRMLRDLQLP